MLNVSLNYKTLKILSEYQIILEKQYSFIQETIPKTFSNNITKIFHLTFLQLLVIIKISNYQITYLVITIYY